MRFTHEVLALPFLVLWSLGGLSISILEIIFLHYKDGAKRHHNFRHFSQFRCFRLVRVRD